VKCALEKQKTKKVSQGKLRCYRCKFHRVNPVQRGGASIADSRKAIGNREKGGVKGEWQKGKVN
jgi:hypothetical protein